MQYLEFDYLFKELGHDVKDEGLPPEEAAQMAARKMTMDQSHDHLWYRINATRTFGGRKKLIPRVLGTFQEVHIMKFKHLHN